MRQRRRVEVAIGVGLVLGASLLPAGAALQTNLACAADTTLSENYADHNLGGLAHVNVGVTQNLTRSRGLYLFDIAGAIPPGSKVVSAALVLEVELVPTEGVPFTDYALHRVLQPWGEGGGTSSRGQGAPALTNEASWYDRFAFTTNAWAEPGGAATNDYVAAASAGQTIYGPENSPYTFGPNGSLAAEVQFWLDHPEANYGWMLRCPDEATPWTARRFGSRESETLPPRLEVGYLVPPRIDQAQRVGNHFNLTFTALPGQGYTVQFRTSMPAAAWQSLVNIGTPPVVTRVLLLDPIAGARRFYRVQVY